MEGKKHSTKYMITNNNKKKAIIVALSLLLMSCYSDKDAFDNLAKEFPHCEILSQGLDYYAVDTLSVHGPIYKILLFPNQKIDRVDRLR